MALVITNLFSAIPFVGNDIVSWLWGGFNIEDRSIPDKLLGVILMFAAILVLLVLPFTDRSVVRGNTFKVLSKFFFFIFVFNFVLLGQIGACHVEVPYVLMGQIATFIYFAYFLIIVPVISTIENVLFYIGRVNK